MFPMVHESQLPSLSGRVRCRSGSMICYGLRALRTVHGSTAPIDTRNLAGPKEDQERPAPPGLTSPDPSRYLQAPAFVLLFRHGSKMNPRWMELLSLGIIQREHNSEIYLVLNYAPEHDRQRCQLRPYLNLKDVYNNSNSSCIHQPWISRTVSCMQSMFLFS